MSTRPAEFERFFDARVSAIETLQAALSGDADDGALDERARALAELGRWIDGTPGRCVGAFAQLLSICALLIRWRDASREAELDSDRFLRAARQRADEALEQMGGDLPCPSVRDALLSVHTVDGPSAVPKVLTTAFHASLPLPLIQATRARGVPGRRAQPAKDDSPAPEPAPVVVVAFRLDDEPLASGSVIQPHVVYDLAVSASISRAPKHAGELVLRPVSVESPADFQLPEFRIPLAGVDEARREFTDVGRLVLRLPQTLGSRPLQFVYRATLVSGGGNETPVHVEGQRRFEIRSYDPQSHPLTGFPEVDLRVQELARDLRRVPGLSEADRAHFCVIMGEVGKIAAMSVASNAFDSNDWTEPRWHPWIRDELRSQPRIGLDLEEHPQIAAGITDLSYHRVRIELKVEREKLVTIDEARGFAPQTAQYVTGSGKRVGILAILDVSPKTTHPGAVENGMWLEVVPDPGGGPIPTAVGVVIVRGNLARPSDLSR